MVQSVDESVGRVQATIAELGLSKETVVLFTSDHGGLSSRGLRSKRELATTNLPLRQGKGSLYEGGTRVPLIVSWPGRLPATTSDAVVTGTDHYATLLELAGLPLMPEQHVDARSYVPALRGLPFERGSTFWHSPLSRPSQTGDTNCTAMRKGRYKVLDWYDDGLVELYDLSQDVGEKQNLAGKRTDKTQVLLSELRRWRETTALNAKVSGSFSKRKQKKGNKGGRAGKSRK
jgi:arylsulfatase A-like enzyme